MDYQAFSIPWTVFTHFGENSSRTGRLSSTSSSQFDGDSVCSSMSPPPSPLSPSPSLASNAVTWWFVKTLYSGQYKMRKLNRFRKRNDDAFHFLPTPDGHHQTGGRLEYDICQQVPALLGLTDAKRSRKASSNGFYSRLLEWLSRKKKTHRRHSEVWRADATHPDLMTARKSAPMILDSIVIDNGQKRLLAAGSSASCASSATSPTGSIRSDASGSSWAGRLRGRAQNPLVRVETCREEEATARSSSSSTERLVPYAEEKLPATPTSCYSVQSGILQFEKQDSADEERGEIDAEWIIPWSDVELGQLISQRGSCTINRGRWHGDVIIHRFELENVDQVNSFWTDVRSLSKLRHENLLLFMGIATDSPTYTIINSAPRGVSVANFRVTIKNGKQERIGMRAAISISRQVAQATGYLHARGIVHGKLNPHNIFLDGDNYRVKLSLLDHGSSWMDPLQLNYGYLPKMQIGYYSPELVRSMIVQPPEVLCSVPSTKYSDVYAIGSFMYDLIAGHPPFHQEEIDSVLYRIGRGQTVDLSELNCNTRLKTLIGLCWSTDAAKRPTCIEVVRGLSPTALLCRSHSCSEPERLNRLGMCKLAC